MLRAVLLIACLSACGRSELFEPAPVVPEPASAAPLPSTDVVLAQPSRLLGHWADFRLGNCINDEAWLSFGERSELTVTSVDRNYCGPHSVAAAKGTYVEGPQTLKLSWAPTTGPRELEASYAIIKRSRPLEWVPQAYQFGDRSISLGAWSGSGAAFTRAWLEHSVEGAKTYARATRAEVAFDAPVLGLAEGSTVTATLRWTSRVEWGEQPPSSLDESFTLPCRVKTEGGVRRVRAVVLDEHDGFWKLLTARGLDKSYGWDLDRVIHAFGPDWLVLADGRLFQAPAWAAPEYLELRQPPPTNP